MRISVQKDDLVRGIQIVQNAVSARGSLPILSNILIEARNELKLTATDLDIAISCVIPCQIEERGAITLPAKRLGDVVKQLWSEEPVQLKLQKNNVVRIESKKTYFKIPGLPVDDFPQIPVFDEQKNAIALPQSLLLNMLRMTCFAMSRDEARYVLNGTYFVIKKNSIRLVATDGRRLALIEKSLEKEIPFEKNVIIPIKTIQELMKNLGEDNVVYIYFKDNQIQFRIHDIFITSRLIEGEFPNYEQVIPQKTKEKIVIKTRDFLDATRRANIFTSQESQSIKITLDKNKLVISKNSPDLGEAYEEIDTNYQGGEFSIGFNPNYLIDVLKQIDDESIEFELIDADKPGMIRSNPHYTYIVLPMQIS